MTLDALKAQLNGFVQSMHDEGLLDHNFDQVRALRDPNNPRFLPDLINGFCNDTERRINDLTGYLDQPTVDYHRIAEFVHQLKGSSSSIGAYHVYLACLDLDQAVDATYKEGCLLALNRIKHEFYHLHGKFQTIVQLENSILAYGARP
ncbi:hypothetical protein HHK36_011345 [Tetracentron sinense]|uniref:Histidine-containing phosphotransfer protein n=1 Tax=Tetracentron sinense TaxID=13715 RepID=A0A834Z922_TETSI|nr:hypothetical protein HHK36_011345 [Tetracentron sinense]